MMNVIELQNVTKTYSKNNSKINALDALDLKINTGEFITVVGPSGSGKTTLIRCIAGLTELSDGKILINGIEKNNPECVRLNIEWIPQKVRDTFLDEYNINFNLSLVLKTSHLKKKERENKILGVSELLGIRSFLDRLPRELSGGELQKIAIARAILKDTDIYLFDEPLSNIDETNRKIFRSEFKKIHKRINGTFIYVSHDQREALSLGTRCIVLNLGKIEQDDIPQNLYSKPLNKFVAKFLSEYWNQYKSSLFIEKLRQKLNGDAINWEQIIDKKDNYVSILAFRGEDLITNEDAKSGDELISLGRWEILETQYFGNRILLYCCHKENKELKINAYLTYENSNKDLELFISRNKIFVFKDS